MGNLWGKGWAEILKIWSILAPMLLRNIKIIKSSSPTVPYCLHWDLGCWLFYSPGFWMIYVSSKISTSLFSDPDTDLQLFFNKYFYFVFVCHIFTFATAYVWRSAFEDWFFPSTMWVSWHQPWVIRLGRKQPSASDWLDKGLYLIVLRWVPDVPAYSLQYDWNVPWALLLCSKGYVVDVLLGAGHLTSSLYFD